MGSVRRLARAEPGLALAVVLAGACGDGGEPPAGGRSGEGEVAPEAGLAPGAALGIGTVFPTEPAAFDEQLRATPSPDAVGAAPRGVDPAIWELLVPDDNETTPARVALGRRLFFDPRLSADGTIACASCHDATSAFVDHQSGSDGIRDQIGRRNSPTVLNAALLASQFWDGRAATLEEQAELPITNPIEMGQPDEAAAVAAIAGDAEYAPMFEQAYGRPPNMDDVGRAIAAFERTLVTLDAPFDRFVLGEEAALSEEARAGWILFNGRARCATCHPVSPSSPLFSDGQFHNIGVAARHQDFGELSRSALAALEEDDSEETIDRLALASDLSELGRFLVTRSAAHMGAFRTPQLRNVGVTPPYMHDGSMQTLWDVMDHYDKGGEANAFLDGGIEPLALTEEEIAQLVAFMFALTDDRFADLAERELARQRAVAEVRRPFRDPEMAQRRRLAFEPRHEEAR
jgi:cytochrome c peroxidase